jgi:hypothetical protein
MSGEKEFRKWLTATAPKDWMVQTIETSTGTGIPDVFMCTDGFQFWSELKATNNKKCYMRISQWRWFCRLVSRGGFGLLMIKRLKEKRIDVYDARELTKFSAATDCVLSGQDITFPDSVKPIVTYKLGTGNGMFYKKLVEKLEEIF